MTYILGLILAISIQLSAESLSDMNKNINQSSQSSSSSSVKNNTQKEQSGYSTDVHVIGSEKRFERVRFSPHMFQSWQRLFISAQTYDLISQLKDQGFVNFDGTLKDTVLKLDVPLTPYNVINQDQIRAYYIQKYTNQWVFDALKQVGVLDAQGFLTDTESFSDEYESKAFDIYLSNIRRIQFNFSNKAISEEMARELLRFFKESSLSIHVTQEETTRYQSRKEGFWDSFVDQLGGSFLGSVFYKDQVKTVKRKMTYTPNLNVLSMFSNVEFGFSRATYAKGAKGDVIFYGQANQNNGSIQYAKNNNDVQHLGGQLSFLNQKRAGLFLDESIQATGMSIHFNELRDTKDHNTWMSARLIFGEFGLTHDNQLSFGISNYTSSLRGDSQLGLAFGWKGTYHATRFIGIYYGFDTNLGFNIFAKENATNWIISRYFLGLQTVISPVKFRLGYEWVNGQDNTNLFDGFTSSVGVYF